MTSLRPVVISGPSGSGKSTLLKILFENFKDVFGFSVSHTSRSPRPGEQNGVDYHFSTKDDMRREIADGEFVEHAEFSGNLYGTSKRAVRDVLNKNMICVLDLEEQGVRSIKGTELDALYIFIKPPSMEVLRERLDIRGSEAKEGIDKRMDTAASAISYSEQPGAYDVVIVNDNLQVAYDKLEAFLREKLPSLSSEQNES